MASRLGPPHEWVRLSLEELHTLERLERALDAPPHAPAGRWPRRLLGRVGRWAGEVGRRLWALASAAVAVVAVVAGAWWPPAAAAGCLAALVWFTSWGWRRSIGGASGGCSRLVARSRRRPRAGDEP